MATTFKEFTDFVEQFKSIPIDLLEFNHRPRTFGDWYMVVRKNEKEFRIVFEGRDNLYALQQQTGPNFWADIWTQSNLKDWPSVLLQQLKSQGHSFIYRKVKFYRAKDGTVECSMQCSWMIENMNDDKAWQDLHFIAGVLDEIKQASPNFFKILESASVKLQLTDSYGMGSINVAHLDKNKIIWDKKGQIK